MVSPASLTAARRVRLRPADEGDFGFVEALYLGMKMSLLPDTKEGAARLHLRSVYRQHETFIVERHGHAIGLLQVEDSPGQAMLSQIHLVPEHRGRGIGTGLIRELLDQARGEGKAVTLNVIEGNPALALYERLGFEVVGRDGPRVQMRWQPNPGPPSPRGPSRSSRRRVPPT